MTVEATIVEVMTDNDDNDDNGTITIVPASTNNDGAELAMSVRDMRFDVSEATGPVTVTVEIEAAGTHLAFLTGPDVKNVIDTIQLGVKVKATMATVRTRGTDDPDKNGHSHNYRGVQGCF